MKEPEATDWAKYIENRYRGHEELQCLAKFLRVVGDRIDGLEKEASDLRKKNNSGYKRLLDAIKEHHRQRADDRCHFDDDDMYIVAGLEVSDDYKLYKAAELKKHDERVGDKFEMLKSCARFIDQRCTQGGPWKSYAELEKENAELRKQLQDTQDQIHGLD